MDAIPLRDDFAKIGIDCCSSNQTAFVDSHHELDYKTEEESAIAFKQPALRTRLSLRMPSSLRASSSDLKASFTKALAPTKENKEEHRSSAAWSASDYFVEGPFDKEIDELFATPSLLHDKDDCSVENNYDDASNTKEETKTACSESRISVPPLEDALALEVGLSAHEYLEECFYTEVSVLNREKFNDVPEIIKSDFTIKVSQHNFVMYS